MQILTEWLCGFTSGLISCRLAFSNAILQLVLVWLVAAMVVLIFWHHVTHPNHSKPTCTNSCSYSTRKPKGPKGHCLVYFYITRFHLNVVSNVVPASKVPTQQLTHLLAWASTGKDILIGDFFMKTAAGQSLSIHHSNSACLASLQPKGRLEIHGTMVWNDFKSLANISLARDRWLYWFSCLSPCVSSSFHHFPLKFLGFTISISVSSIPRVASIFGRDFPLAI